MPQTSLQINRQKLHTFIKNNCFFYLTGFLLLLGMKYFYSRTNVNHLTWLLAPTARWVQALSGIPFHFVPYEGYVNHTYQFVIARSCCGMQFMIITIATLLFPFIPQMDTTQKKIRWMISILPVSYILTILVNIIRILLSIYLPVIMQKKPFRKFFNPRKASYADWNICILYFFISYLPPGRTSQPPVSPKNSATGIFLSRPGTWSPLFKQELAKWRKTVCRICFTGSLRMSDRDYLIPNLESVV